MACTVLNNNWLCRPNILFANKNKLLEKQKIPDMNRKLLFISFMCFIFFGCMGNMEKEKSNLKSFTDKFHVQPISIALDSLSLDHYERGIATHQTDSIFFYVAYNKHTHAIDWFDITNKKLHHRALLEKQGPNAIIDQADGLYVHTIDSIFLNDGVFIYLTNKEGTVKRKIQNSFETEMGKAYLVNSLNSPLHYFSKKNSIIGEAIVPNNQFSQNKALFLEINLDTEDVYLHKAEISDCYTKAGTERKWLNVSFKGDSIIYNSTCSSDIFVYDTNSKNTTVYDGRSSLSKNRMSQIKKEDPEALWKHYIENPRFFKIVFTPADKRYYRLHWKESVYKIDQSTFTTAYDKPIILSVFSEDFELLFESILPEHKYLIDFLIPAPQGLILSANNVKNQNYDINKKELHILNYLD
jgi:hypothetical protein